MMKQIFVITLFSLIAITTFAQGDGLDGNLIEECDSNVTEINQYGVLGNCYNLNGFIINVDNTPFFNEMDGTFGFYTEITDSEGNVNSVDTTIFQMCADCFSSSNNSTYGNSNNANDEINCCSKNVSSIRANGCNGMIEMVLTDGTALPLNMANLPIFTSFSDGNSDANIVSGGLFIVNNQLYVKP